MASPYYESFGEDPYDDEDLPADWYYGTPGEENKIRNTIWYNWHTRQWECTCYDFQFHEKCIHVHRYRAQETIKVNEDYL